MQTNPGPIPNASATKRGAVSSIAQIFGGLKTFNGGVFVPSDTAAVALGSCEMVGNTFSGNIQFRYASGAVKATINTATGAIGMPTGVNLTLGNSAIQEDANGHLSHSGTLGMLRSVGGYAAGGLTAGAPAFLGSYNGSSASALWLGVTNPAVANYALLRYSGGGLIFNAPFNEGHTWQHNGNAIATLGSTGTFSTAGGNFGGISLALTGIGVAASSFPLNMQSGWGITDNSTAEAFRFLSTTTFSDPLASIMTWRNSNVYATTPVAWLRSTGRMDTAGGFLAKGAATLGFETYGDNTSITVPGGGGPGEITINAAKGRTMVNGSYGQTIVTCDKCTASSVVVAIFEDPGVAPHYVSVANGSFTVGFDGGGWSDAIFRFIVFN